MTPRQRIAIASLSLSMMGFVGIVMREGYSSDAIIPTKGDVPTYGFGTTTGVKIGDKTTPPRAVARAASELDTIYEAGVKRCAPVPMFQAEYDVWVDFTYNVGVSRFCASTAAKKLKLGDYAGSCQNILAYKYAGGFDCSTPGNKRCAGLWTDRQRSYSNCMAAQ